MTTFKISVVLASALFIVGCGSVNETAPDGGSAEPQDASTLPGADAGPEVCVTFPTRFDQDTTIQKGCYLAGTTPVLGAAVTLTLSPGVKIVFSSDVALRFSGEQKLIATGTPEEPILLTGAEPQRGHWKGLLFDLTSNVSRLDYVTVEYAGSTKIDRDAAAVKLTADSRGSRLSMTHSTLRESQGWGLWLTGSAVVPEFAANVLTRNLLGPVSLDAATVDVLDTASSYAGNDVDRVQVRAYGLARAATWRALGVPFFLASDLVATADLTIAPGVTVIMASQSRLKVSSDAGALIANGTAASPILFTGENPVRGNWEGIIFDGSNNSRNVMRHVTVEWAGSTTASNDKDAAAVKLIADSHGVQLAISDSTLRQSQGWGLYLAGSALVPAFSGNVLTQNTLGPASVDSASAHQLLATSTYTGNDLDRVRVRAGWVTQAVTWEDVGVPYAVLGLVRPQNVWTLAPGVTLLMEPDAGISVNGDAAGFHAAGTAADPILITGVEQVKGSWNNIVFGMTNNPANALEHCTIEYGGGGTAFGYQGMIQTAADSHGVTVSVTDCILRSSAVCAIWRAGSAVLTTSGNTFADNTGGEICAP